MAITDEQFAKLVADQLNEDHVNAYADFREDRVEGSLMQVIDVILEITAGTDRSPSPTDRQTCPPRRRQTRPTTSEGETPVRSSEFRIDYTIHRRNAGHDDFTEIGFGSSGGDHSDVDAALYAIQSDIQNRQWETVIGQPEPSEVDDTDEEAPTYPTFSTYAMKQDVLGRLPDGGNRA